MTRWFILLFVMLVFVAVNAFAFHTGLTVDSKVFVAIAGNIFGVSLLLIWLGCYFERAKQLGLAVFGHAALMLSVGLSFIGFGFHGLLAGECSFLVDDRQVPGGLSRLAKFAIENNACLLLCWGLMAIGLVILWPSIKLFIGITSRSRSLTS